MNQINGRYLYDINTGKTLARRKDDIKNSEDNPEYNYDAIKNYGGSNFLLLKSVATSNAKDRYDLKDRAEMEARACTVEDLSFEQIVNLFTQGNLVIDELKIGLEAKNAKNIDINDSNNITTVTFEYEGKQYTLKCATDATTSQIDNSSEVLEDSGISQILSSGHLVSIDELSSNYDLYDYDLRYDIQDGGIIHRDYSNCNMTPLDAYLNKVTLPLLRERFGGDLNNLEDWNGEDYISRENSTFSWLSNATDEQIEEINSHPEIYHLHLEVSSVRGERSVGIGVDPLELNKFLLEDGGYQMNAEETYSANVIAYGDKLNGRRLDSNCSVEYLRSDGENVKFTDDAAEKIKKAIKEHPSDAYLIMLGITAEDDEDAIWGKINNFCKSTGSSDPKSLSLESLYILTSKIENNKSYDEIVDELELAKNSQKTTKMINDMFGGKFWSEITGTGEASNPTNLNQLFIKNYNYMKNTTVSTKIKSSELPADAEICEFNDWEKSNEYFDDIVKEFYYQIDDTDKYILKPEIANLSGSAFFDYDFFADYMSVRDTIIDINLRTGNYNVPATKIEDFLKIPEKFGVDNGIFSFENFVNNYRDLKNEDGDYLFSTQSSNPNRNYDVYDFNCLMEKMYPEYYGDRYEVDNESEQRANVKIAELFATGNLSEEMLAFLDMEVEYSDIDNCINIAGITIQLPIPETTSKLYSKEDLQNFGLDRSVVEVATINNRTGETKYRLKPTDKEQLRTDLTNNYQEDFSANEESVEINTVNTNALISYGNSIDADTLLSAEILYTNDESVKKLETTIINGINEYSDYLNTDAKKKEFVNHIIRRLNIAVGINNTTPPSLSKEALDKLNENNIFKQIDNIIHSSEFKTLITDPDSLNLPDGELSAGDFCQGDLGDCGLVSAVVSIINTDTGKKLIKDSIESTGDSFVFKFKGLGITYEFTTDEFKEFVEKEKHSIGDTDIMLIEMAFTKLVQDHLDGKYPNILDHSLFPVVSRNIEKGFPLLFEISPDTVVKALVPTNYALKNNEVDLPKEELFNQHPCVATVSLPSGAKCTCTDGSTFSYDGVDSDLDGKLDDHSFSVVGMTKDSISITNPWEPTTVYTMTWEEYSKLKGTLNFSAMFDKDEFEKSLFSVITDSYGNVTTIDGSQYTIPNATLAELFNLNNSTDYTSKDLEKTVEELFGWNSREKININSTNTNNITNVRANVNNFVSNTENLFESSDVLEEMQIAAEKLNLTAAKTQGIYCQYTTQGSYLCIWDPQTKKFKTFPTNVRNADGSISSEFTQSGKALKRTETNLYYEALLEAYKLGLNFTANFPWVCNKDGVYYEFDKNIGEFKKKTN